MSLPVPLDDLDEILRSLRECGLVGDGEQFGVASLSGGVSCDVLLVEVERRPPVVVKRALAKLRVDADWRAPVERSESEVAWLVLAAELDQRIVPRVIAQDPARHLFAMAYLPKEKYPVWKDRLAQGDADPGFAAEVGSWLGRLHASTARSPSIARRFGAREQFHALRLDPYLLYTAARHPDVATRIRALSENVAHANIALMHGDVSPKNILCGPETPVFLDAETACYGDPAFDLAFCLNHLLLKGVWHPEFRASCARCFDALTRAYLEQVNWELAEHLESRALPLLASLLLARIDGKSPVEYLAGDEAKKDFVRGQAIRYLTATPSGLSELAADFGDAIARHLAGVSSA